MKCTLMHKRLAVAELELDETTGFILKIDEVYQPEHLPVGVSFKNGIAERGQLNEWWTDRSIPASRSGVRNALENLNITNTKALLVRCFGLSLSDQYWIKPQDSDIAWDKINFFENAFSEDIGDVLFGRAMKKEGFDFSSPVGQLVVHVGASRTEVAMIFLGEMVTHLTIPVGGTQFDSAIIEHMRKRHGIYIGNRTAEQIKIRIGTVSKSAEEQTLDVKGRCTKTKEGRVVTVSSKEMLGALTEPLTAILDAIISVIEQTGDDMRADIAKTGVMLTGGALLAGMDKFLDEVMGLRVRRAANAETAAVEGAVVALSRL